MKKIIILIVVAVALYLLYKKFVMSSDSSGKTLYPTLFPTIQDLSDKGYNEDEASQILEAIKQGKEISY